MKKISLLITAVLFSAAVSFSQNTYLKITLDTKQMTNPDYSLGGGNGIPSTCDKVYAHLGLCTCNLNFNGTEYIRDCHTADSNQYFCYHQILPYRSNVWEHVVGNWGENPQDDGIGLMTSLGNGVYSIEFYIEDYFTNPALVNTNTFVDPNDPRPIVNSTVWNPSDGGSPQTIGMVFRNADGTLTGRDDLGKDLFIVNLKSGSPQVVQGSDPSTTFSAITFVTGIGEYNNDIHYVSVSPNPFREQTQIIYTLLEQTKNLNIKIFNSIGQEVKNLYSGAQTSGSHSIFWDGTSNSGQDLPSGVYYFTLSNNNTVIASDKVVISK
ncbi:MAG: T9SS type A sorting domain-containing protein [Bacteroidetes bacterium]|nr:T9SS type A sorting domain-containing protein [Bacteroidota bacterium]